MSSLTQAVKAFTELALTTEEGPDFNRIKSNIGSGMYTFDYNYENPDDEADTQSTTHTVNAQADLTELLTAFGYFLHAAGFTYVTGLAIHKVYDDDGLPLTAEVQL